MSQFLHRKNKDNSVGTIAFIFHVWYFNVNIYNSVVYSFPLLRTEAEHTKEVVKPYDWTYTTDYKGTLLGDAVKLKVTSFKMFIAWYFDKPTCILFY